MPISLSNRQAKNADRVGGIELMILWPRSLGPAPDIAPDHEREATDAERAAAEAMVRDSCAAHDLVPVHVRVAAVHRHKNLPPHEPGYYVHLAVTIIGRRWVRAMGAPRGPIFFASE